MPRAMKAFFVASFLIICTVPTAQAVPIDINIRIEGKSETLFEKTIPVEPRNVQASSDTTERRCDGINPNVPQNATPAPTPTAASTEAMASIGETFDGQWYEGFEDYFITRWGPDMQDTAAGAYWGVLVNEAFTNVGGCQYQLDSGDEVLWVYDAFKSRPTLALFPEDAHYAAGLRPVTAIAQLGKPFTVEVASYADDEESVPPASPTRSGSSPYPGAEISPVVTNAKGFERVDTGSTQTVATDAQGRASIVFTEPGWHRIKATEGDPGEETVIRSNRLDVCVPATPGDCGEHLASPPPPADDRRPRVGAFKLNRKDIDHGKLGVSWKVLDPGAGIRRWRISSKRVGRRGGHYVGRASDTRGTSARIHLPAGATYRLRFTVTDALGRDTDLPIGKATVPRAGKE